MARTLSLAALALAFGVGCSSTPPDNDSVGSPGDAAPTCAVAAIDAGFASLAQVCAGAAAPGSLQKNACGPYVIVTRGTDTGQGWYFDAQSGALVAVVSGGTCTTTQASFASQWGTSAWGCATGVPLCAGDGGADAR